MSYLDADGRELSSAAAGASCCADPANTLSRRRSASPGSGCASGSVYQPADRYVWFQLAEAGLLLVVSAGLAWGVRRRVANAV